MHLYWRFNSPLDESIDEDRSCSINDIICSERSFVRKNYIVSSQLKFSCAQAVRFLTSFSDNRVSYVALKYLILWTCNSLLIVSHDNFKSFFSNIACRFAVIVEYCLRIGLFSDFVVFFMGPRFGRSFPFSTAEYCFIHLFTNALYFFMYLAVASRVIFGPFEGVQSNTASNRDAYAALIAKYVVLTERANVTVTFCAMHFGQRASQPDPVGFFCLSVLTPKFCQTRSYQTYCTTLLFGTFHL
jgi:hypothetical protein